MDSFMAIEVFIDGKWWCKGMARASYSEALEQAPHIAKQLGYEQYRVRRVDGDVAKLLEKECRKNPLLRCPECGGMLIACGTKPDLMQCETCKGWQTLPLKKAG